MKTQDIEHPSVFLGRKLVTVTSDSHVGEALVMMSERGIHHLPVVDGGRVVGLITDRDILRKLVEMEGLEDPLEDAVSSVMRPNIPTIDENTEVREVLKLMREQTLSALPVVENGELTGLVTETDMLRALEKVLQTQASAPPAAPDILSSPLLQRVVNFLGQIGI